MFFLPASPQNPEYKGKWAPPLVDNPKYKGEWKAREVPNPDHHKDPAPLTNIGKVRCGACLRGGEALQRSACATRGCLRRTGQKTLRCTALATTCKPNARLQPPPRPLPGGRRRD